MPRRDLQPAQHASERMKGLGQEMNYSACGLRSSDAGEGRSVKFVRLLPGLYGVGTDPQLLAGMRLIQGAGERSMRRSVKGHLDV